MKESFIKERKGGKDKEGSGRERKVLYVQNNIYPV